jgi:hypothetical protein
MSKPNTNFFQLSYILANQNCSDEQMAGIFGALKTNPELVKLFFGHAPRNDMSVGTDSDQITKSDSAKPKSDKARGRPKGSHHTPPNDDKRCGYNLLKTGTTNFVRCTRGLTHAQFCKTHFDMVDKRDPSKIDRTLPSHPIVQEKKTRGRPKTHTIAQDGFKDILHLVNLFHEEVVDLGLDGYNSN